MTFKNSKAKGNVGLGVAIGWFCRNGYIVCVPLTDSQDYDLVVDIKGVLQKVQVRTTFSKARTGVYQVGLRVLGGNSKRNFVHKRGDELVYDFLFVYANGTMYFIPRSEIKNTSSITLCEKYKKFVVS